MAWPVLKLGCVLAGKARVQRLGRARLHVAAATSQSARFAVRGGTPVPKNSVLIVGATGTLGGLQMLINWPRLRRTLLAACWGRTGSRRPDVGLCRPAGRQIVRLSLDEGYEVCPAQAACCRDRSPCAACKGPAVRRCAASCARGKTRRTSCGTGARRPCRRTSTTPPPCRPPWCAAAAAS